MLIEHKTWDRIRRGFTAKEKEELNSVITGNVICPPGIAINEQELSEALYLKLLTACSDNGRIKATMIGVKPERQKG